MGWGGAGGVESNESVFPPQKSKFQPPLPPPPEESGKKLSGFLGGENSHNLRPSHEDLRNLFFFGGGGAESKNSQLPQTDQTSGKKNELNMT